MKKVDYEHFGRFVYPRNLEARGEDLYYIVTRANFEDNKYNSDLYRLSGGEITQITASGDVTAYYPLESGIVFPSLRNDKDKEAAKSGRPLTVLYQMPYGGGEARELLRLDHAVTGFYFLAPDRFFFTTAYSHALAAAVAAGKGDMEAALKTIKEEADYTVLDELPYWFNGMGWINKVRNRLYCYDQGTVTPLVDEFTGVEGVSLSPDKKRLAYTAQRYTDTMPLFNSLYLVETDTLAQTDISLDGATAHGGVEFISSDEMLIFASDTKTFGLNQNSSVYHCNFATKAMKLLYDRGEHGFYGSVGGEVRMGSAPRETALIRDGGYYCINTLDDSAHLCRLDIASGEITTLTRERGIVDDAVLFGDGFAIIAQRGLDGAELYALDMDGAETRLTDLNTALAAQYESSAPIDVHFDNEDGVSIHGWVIPPVKLKKGEKAPAILDIHGGPKTAYGTVYFHEMQLWASRGFAVLYCNPTGSDGRGNTFADIRGRYGTVDYRDIMRFVDTCLTQFDFIDENRLGVTGGSYGGFMTNWIIGHTDRFKAAASQRSISNWTSFSSMADIGPHFGKDQNGLMMWDDIALLWDQSPLKYADKVKTPTLFIHSDEDYRCPAAEGMQMFTALKYHGVPTRLVLFKGENHELSRSGKPKHRVRRLKEITEWMERYLK